MTHVDELLQNVFDAVRVSWPSLVVAYGIGVSAGVVGLFVLLRREALLGLALPQVVAVGCALGMRMDWNPLAPSFAMVSAALFWLARSRGDEAHSSNDSQALLPCLYVGGLSLSILLIAHGGAHVEEMQTLLTGGDVFVTELQATVATPLLLVIAIGCAVLWRRFLAMAQLPSAMRLSGWKPWRWECLFLVFLAAVALIGTNTMGSLMVLALLLLPPAIVLPWSSRIPQALLGAIGAGVGLVTIGFIVAALGDYPFSQSVGTIGFAAVVISRVALLLVRPRLRLAA